MENRFGVKDLVLFLMVAVLIVLVVLGMVQYDRQWDLVRQTNEKLQQQTGDLARIRRLLEQGHLSVGAVGAAPTTAEAPADERVVKIHANPDYAPGDSVIDVFSVIPDKLTPLISTDQYSVWVQAYVLDALCDRDPNTFEWKPRVATSWKVSDDGLTIDFQLRRGITFSDGEPLTADDVVFTINWTLDERVEAPRMRVYLDKLAKVEKTGDYSVRFVFKEPYFKAFETAAGTQVMSRKFYSQFTPKQFNESTGLLIGSGPYRLPDPKNWRPEPGRPIELVRNERYWGEPPGLNKLVWRVIELPQARMTEFRNGGTDVFTRPTPEQYDDMKKDPDFAPRIQQYAMDVVTAGYLYFGWNQKQADGKPSRFADARVRRAMTMLLDREAVIRDIVHGYATVSAGPFSHLSPQADPALKPLPFDPEQAQKLLAEAGCQRRGGTLYGPDGKEFRFQMSYPSAGEVTKRIVSYAKDAFARAGIIMDLVPSEWSVLLDKTKERKFDAVCMGWGGVIEEDPQQIFHSDSIKGTGDNFVQYSNKQLDELIDKARKTVNDEQRMKLWHQAERIIADDQPYTFICADWDLIALDKRFKGFEPTKTGLDGIAKNEWYVPAPMQKYK
jgi:peptide/nickel transport system substrate-binding protein